MSQEKVIDSDLVEELQGLLEGLGDDVMDAGVADGFLTAMADSLAERKK